MRLSVDGKKCILSGMNLLSLPEFPSDNQIEELFIMNNSLTSLDGIERLPCLRILYCSRNNLRTLKALYNLQYLEYIDCSFNKLSSLEGLEQSYYLQFINCKNNNIHCLNIVNELPNLTKIIY